MKGHHMCQDCLFLLVCIKPDTLLLRQPKELTYSLIREQTKWNKLSRVVGKHLPSRKVIQVRHVLLSNDDHT